MALLWTITIPLQWLCTPFWTVITILPTVLQLAAAVAMLSLVYLAAKNVLSKTQVCVRVYGPAICARKAIPL